MNIPSKDISVVIQGPLYRNLAPAGGVFFCVQSIQKHLPEAEIIISSWEQEDVSGLENFRVVQSPMPPTLINPVGNDDNINRQIVSTVEGLKLATRPYALKIRSDLSLSDNSIASIRAYADYVPKERRYFKLPLTLTNVFTRDPTRMPFLFHFSDIIQFGLREDMLAFWDGPAVTYEEAFRVGNPSLNPFGKYADSFGRHGAAEQHLPLRWMRKHGYNIQLVHACEVSTELLDLSERILIENFTVLEWQNAGVRFPHRFMRNYKALRSVYSTKALREIEARLDDRPYRRQRRLKLWLNQYVYRCFQLSWYLGIIAAWSLILSPALMKRLRQIWRRFRKLDEVKMRL